MCATDRDVDAAHPSFVIGGRVLAKEGVQRGLATIESSPLVRRRQKLDARFIHGAA